MKRSPKNFTTPLISFPPSPTAGSGRRQRRQVAQGPLRLQQHRSTADRNPEFDQGDAREPEEISHHPLPDILGSPAQRSLTAPWRFSLVIWQTAFAQCSP